MELSKILQNLIGVIYGNLNDKNELNTEKLWDLFGITEDNFEAVCKGISEFNLREFQKIMVKYYGNDEKKVYLEKSAYLYYYLKEIKKLTLRKFKINSPEIKSEILFFAQYFGKPNYNLPSKAFKPVGFENMLISKEINSDY
jgi:hypothetical protein